MTATEFFLGLPSALSDARSGYIPSDVVICQSSSSIGIECQQVWRCDVVV